MEKVLIAQISRSFLISLILSGLWFCSTVSVVSAATPSLRLTPPFTELVLDTDRPEASFDIQVQNSGDNYETFGVSVIDFGSLDDSGGVAFLGNRGSDYEFKYGLASWVVVDKSYLQVPPQGTDKIKVTVVNRESLSPGGHYAAVLLSSQATAGNRAGNVSFNYAFSSLIFVKKLGGEITRLDLTRITGLSSLFRLPQKPGLMFQNSGNIHLVPRGEVTITDLVGRRVGHGVVNPESGIILPESFRRYPVNILAQSPAFLPGRYQVLVKYRFDGQQDYTTYQTTYWHLGLPFVISLAVCLLTPVLWFQILRRKNLNKNHVKK